MLSISRFCRSAFILPQIKQIVSSSPRNFVRNGAEKWYSTSVFRRQTLFNRSKLTNFLRGSGTVAVRLNSDVSNKGQRAVGYWLLTCSGMVFVAVVLGGVTRLTESGLSMVTWKLLGEKMPRTEAEWEEEFRKYQQFPEFKIKNKEMTLSQFKLIWYIEYGHHNWGPAMGACFFIPAVYFWARGRFTRGLKKRVVVFGTLTAILSLVSWNMVRSVPEGTLQGESDIPRVSQYKQAGHLSLALFVYSLFFWSTLHHFFPPETVTITTKEAIKASKRFRWLAHTSKGLIYFTAVSGAFVSALNAGLVYNSFPKMADKWIPDDSLALSPKLSNFTENPTRVQLNHRVLGIFTLTFLTGVWVLSRRRILPPRAYKAATALAVMAYLQVALGISTLLAYVPSELAIGHQTGSILLLSTALWLALELKKLPK